MRVIGFDPGLTRTGYAVVEKQGGRLAPIANGVIKTSAADGTGARLASLRSEVVELMRVHRPEAAAVERLFFNSNTKTAMAVGQASGVVLCIAAEAGVEIATYTPTDVKLAVVGYGAASKDQVGEMVASLLGLEAAPRDPDASDACALAICHLNRHGLAEAIRKATA